jgi:hypothetical protein
MEGREVRFERAVVLIQSGRSAKLPRIAQYRGNYRRNGCDCKQALT